MAVESTIKRYSLIVGKIREGRYPTLEQLSRHLERSDVAASDRTIQRDLEQIRTMMGFEIIYSREHKGYYIEAHTYDVADKFLRLQELSEPSSVILETMKDAHDVLSKIHLGSSVMMKGAHQCKDVLHSIRKCLEIKFLHENYHSGEQKEVALQPLLLKEYAERWYVYGFSTTLNEYRTYGLDRISGLQVTDRTFTPDAAHDPVERFNEQIGVSMTEGPKEEVLLLYTPLQAKYAMSLPLHTSQKVVEERADGTVISMKVKLNYELLQNILKTGSEVKVLSPPALAAWVKETLEDMLQQYQ